MARRVLVVEDDENIARLVRLQLQELSCTVRTASDGAVGLAEAVAAEWDLIILDLMLPSVDGLEICRRVRGKDRYPPILMLTAKSSELDRVLGLEMGADDYLTKPFSVMELSAWCRCWRNTSRSQRRPTSSIPRRGCSRPTCALSWILQRRGCASGSMPRLEAGGSIRIAAGRRSPAHSRRPPSPPLGTRPAMEGLLAIEDGSSASRKEEIHMRASRRSFLGLLVLGAVAPAALAGKERIPLEVWKGPSCECCNDWIRHVEANGFSVRSHNTGNQEVRARLGLPVRYGSCHTALVAGYAIEGHVPAKEIHRLLRERPDALGLTVPAMPVGTPGMDGPEYRGRKDPYDVLLVRKDGSATVFQSYRS